MNNRLIDAIQDVCGDALSAPEDPFGYVRVSKARIVEMADQFNKEMHKHGRYNRKLRGGYPVPKPPAPPPAPAD